MVVVRRRQTPFFADPMASMRPTRNQRPTIAMDEFVLAYL